jgi:cell shape-determining protein MreC
MSLKTWLLNRQIRNLNKRIARYEHYLVKVKFWLKEEKKLKNKLIKQQQKQATVQ